MFLNDDGRIEIGTVIATTVSGSVVAVITSVCGAAETTKVLVKGPPSLAMKMKPDGLTVLPKEGGTTSAGLTRTGAGDGTIVATGFGMATIMSAKLVETDVGPLVTRKVLGDAVGAGAETEVIL